MLAERKHEIKVPIIRPTLPSLDEIAAVVYDSWAGGVVTVGPIVAQFEAAVRTQTGTEHAVALSSCTAGLMLIPQALDLPKQGEVIVPAFTFAATAQALVWNGLTPVFCDCLPGTKTLDPDDVKRNISPKTVAICPVNIYGLPPDIESLKELGEERGIPVYFDSAQGLGSTYLGKAAGSFGACEVFSLSPTKVITAIEGGVITTNNAALADKFRSMRDYGKDPVTGEEMVSLGLSARMSELHAAVGLISIRNAQKLIQARRNRISQYRKRLASFPGCSVQEFPLDRTSSGNYFVLFVSKKARISRDELYQTLKINGIQTKRYFYPALHLHKVLRNFPFRISASLEHTLQASAEAIALPLHSDISDDQFEFVCSRIEDLLIG